MSAIYLTAGEESNVGNLFNGRGGEQWRLRWYITIEVVHNNQLFIPSDDDNNGQ